MIDNRKAITVSFVAVSLMVGFVVHLLSVFLAQNMALFARVESNELLSNGVPVVFGAITFMALQFNKTVVDFTDGVVTELMKVVWPSRKDTGVMTVVVTITLILSGIVIGVFDSAWAYLINYFVK